MFFFVCFVEDSSIYQHSRTGELCYKGLDGEAFVIKSRDWSREREIETVPIRGETF